MRRYRFLVLYACVVVALSVVYRFVPIAQDDVLRSLTFVEGRVGGHVAETATLFCLVSAILAYFSFPAMPLLYIAAGYCLGTLYGGLAVLLGSACGGFGAFLLYRKHIPARFHRPATAAQSAKMWMTLVGLRLSPIVPAPLVNSFAAILEVSPVQFITTTLIGSAPLIYFYEVMGQQGHGLLHGEPADWRQFIGYASILCISTILSLLGPWRSFLAAIRHVKDDIFAAMAKPAKPDLQTPTLR